MAEEKKGKQKENRVKEKRRKTEDDQGRETNEGG